MAIASSRSAGSTTARISRAPSLAGDEVERRVLDELERLGVDYERIDIDPEFADTAEFCERYGFALSDSANTIIVASKKAPRQYAACLVRADTRLDVNHRVRKLMGVSRLSFARADETLALTGMMIGGVTVFALPDEVPIYVDARLLESDFVIVGGGSRSLKLRVAPDVLSKLANCAVVEGLTLADA